MRRYIEDLSASGVAFTGLPEGMRNQHFEGGGKVLSRAVEFARKGKPAPFGNATPQDIVARLHSASAGGSYQIVWEAFADTQANPGPDVVKEIAPSWIGAFHELELLLPGPVLDILLALNRLAWRVVSFKINQHFESISF